MFTDKTVANTCDKQEADSENSAILYKCGLCLYIWFNKRYYNRYKSLYHRGLPMIEKTHGNRQIYILDETVPHGLIPIIYTCVICRTDV